MPIKQKSWQRLTLSLIGLSIIVLTWMQAVAHLYTLPPAALASFTTITVNSQYVIASIVIFMVTGRLIYEWKNSTVSNIVETGEQIKQDIKEDIHSVNETIFAPKHFDDGTLP